MLPGTLEDEDPFPLVQLPKKFGGKVGRVQLSLCWFPLVQLPKKFGGFLAVYTDYENLTVSISSTSEEVWRRRNIVDAMIQQGFH